MECGYKKLYVPILLRKETKDSSISTWRKEYCRYNQLKTYSVEYLNSSSDDVGKHRRDRWAMMFSF